MRARAHLRPLSCFPCPQLSSTLHSSSNYGWAEGSLPTFLTSTFFLWRFCKREQNIWYMAILQLELSLKEILVDPRAFSQDTPKWVWPKMVLHGLQCDPQIHGFDSKVVPIKTQWTNSCTRIQIHGLWCHDTPFGWNWKHFDIYPWKTRRRKDPKREMEFPTHRLYLPWDGTPYASSDQTALDPLHTAGSLLDLVV